MTRAIFTMPPSAAVLLTLWSVLSQQNVLCVCVSLNTKKKNCQDATHKIYEVHRDRAGITALHVFPSRS